MTQVFLISGTSWTVPGDWNSGNNSVETIAGGGGGRSGDGAGGGAGYSKISNLALTLGAAIQFQIGAGGLGGAAGGGSDGADGTDTWFNGATLAASSVGAKAGLGGTSSAGGAGGAAASGIGTTKHSGGSGGGGGPGYGSSAGGAAGPGGDGAAGIVGGNNGGASGGANGGGGVGVASSGNAGATGGSSISTGNQVGQSGGAGAVDSSHDGGAGSQGSGGGGGYGDGSTVSTKGGKGGDGTEWSNAYGSGGGGAGSGYAGSNVTGNPAGVSAGNGGLYGGGGGSSSVGGGELGTSRGAGGNAGQGIVVITYSPLVRTFKPSKRRFVRRILRKKTTKKLLLPLPIIQPAHVISWRPRPTRWLRPRRTEPAQRLLRRPLHYPIPPPLVVPRFNQGVAFRNTKAFVSDAPFFDYPNFSDLGTTYPQVTRQNNTVGFTNFYPTTIGQDQIQSQDQRLCGNLYNKFLTAFVTPPAPSVPDTTPLGATVATLSAMWSDQSTFTGSFIFVAPGFDDGGIFAISGSNLIVNPNGSGIPAGGLTANVTIEATQ